jgi:hypothetical protein
MEAGFIFQRPNEIVNLVLLCVGSESELLKVLDGLRYRGIQFAMFNEPDDDMGFTAACTEPLQAHYRREFRNFPLWPSSGEVIKG